MMRWGREVGGGCGRANEQAKCWKLGEGGTSFCMGKLNVECTAELQMAM